MKPLCLALLLLLLTPAASRPADSAKRPEFLHGADLSFLPQVERHGGVFRDAGTPGDALEILRRHGFNYVRLRLWHSPPDGHSALPEVLALARRAHALGYRLLIDFHYSDSWADPGRQNPPLAWEGLELMTLCDSVEAYTERCVAALAAQGTPPDMVQLGNEITPGLLWDVGRVGGIFDTPVQWRRLAFLLGAARRGALHGVEEDVPAPRIMVHLDAGGNAATCRWFLDHLFETDMDCDVIGVSYYPWWHGTPEQLAANLSELAERYRRDVAVVETAYPWTLQAFDTTANQVGRPDQLAAGFPATPEGQRAFLSRVAAAVRSVPGGRGLGLFYWAPDWIPAPGLGSAWENCALFDARGELLPAADALSDSTR